MNLFFNRMLRAARLDVTLYEEVEADRGAMRQAMGTVVLASLAAGIGSVQQLGFGGILMGTLLALLSWYIWAFLTYWIGTRLLPEPQTQANYGELLRTIGFSSAPGILRILGGIPGLGTLVFFVAGVWMLVAMIIAVRQALDYRSTWRAVGVCLIGWVVQAVVLAALMFLAGGPQTPAVQSGS
ncbi:MAG TPA: YIP1 family protein [Desulfobacterales bacterium]